ncbi:MAG: 2-succinyl-6-hydroxy-2,4-cyclohexadiene-1-carboxylate synthase [Anaerolineales bacterium]|nr:2-succinyl-6-hydroxy-2,4-cyclohexadiene-1-carboxylate synthase [Anaerolineales bacterium]
MKVTLNGINYYVKLSGAGAPLLMLHGFTGSSENWQGVAPELAAQNKLIMPDLLGHGRTEALAEPERYQMAQAAADLAALLDHLKIHHANVLGYSMGGRLALYFATHYPQRVHSLILESSSPGLATAAERTERQQQDEALATRIETEGIEKFVDFWESLPMWESQRVLPLSVRNMLHEKRLNNRPEGLANSLRGMGTGAQPSLWDKLAQLPHPTLLLTGLRDTKFVAINQQMSKQIPTAALQLISHAGHTIHLERPDHYTQTILTFLRQHPVAPVS